MARLGGLLPPAPPGEVWFGDDTAAVRFPGTDRLLLLATDAVVGGLDADLSLTTLADLGWKALAVNLSDIAAMGGSPAYCVASVIGLRFTEVEELYAGMLEAAALFSCPVVGGDLSGGDQVVVSVAVTGWVDDPPVLRSGACPGDVIWVTGPLGAAAAGLRLLKAGSALAAPGAPAPSSAIGALVRAHARPRPALAEGAAARRAGATAMIDVSDGLAADLGHIADCSGVGLELTDVPVAEGATLQEALGGGDDYVLAFTLPAGVDPSQIFSAAGLSLPHRLGICLENPQDRLLAGKILEPFGWEHLI